MKVLHVFPANKEGNQPVFIRQQLDSLKDYNIQSSEFAISGSSLALVDIPRVVRDLKSKIAVERPDVIHAHWGSVLSVITLVAKLFTKTKLVVTYRGSDINPTPSESVLSSGLRVLLSRIAGVFADRVVCVSQGLADRIWFAKSIDVIPDGTDIDKFSRNSYKSARESLSWPHDEYVLFFYEGDRPEVKRTDIALEVLGLLEERILNHPVRLEILGQGSDQVLVAEKLAGSDCLLMLSDFEGSPNIVREAIVCGTPVVSFDVGDVDYWLRDDERRGVVVSRSADDVAEATHKMLDDGLRGPSVSDDVDFSKSSVGKRIVELYRELVDES